MVGLMAMGLATNVVFLHRQCLWMIVATYVSGFVILPMLDVFFMRLAYRRQQQLKEGERLL
jgi:hypothetical protein